MDCGSSNSNGNGELMPTYIQYKGITVEVLAADPSNPDDGQLWYNSTSNTLKGYNGSTTKTITAS